MGDPEVVLERSGSAVTPPGARACPRLQSPFRLGRLALPNRFVIPGLMTNFGTADGFVTDALSACEAGRATRTVYDAVARAMALDGAERVPG